MITFAHLAPVGLNVVVAEHHVVYSEEGVQLTRLLAVEHILVDLTQRKKDVEGITAWVPYSFIRSLPPPPSPHIP